MQVTEFATVFVLRDQAGIKNDVLTIRPLMNFPDDEIRNIVTARDLPLIPEDCKEVTGRDAVSDSPRRDFTVALAALRKKYASPGPVAISDYDQAKRLF